MLNKTNTMNLLESIEGNVMKGKMAAPFPPHKFIAVVSFDLDAQLNKEIMHRAKNRTDSNRHAFNFNTCDGSIINFTDSEVTIIVTKQLKNVCQVYVAPSEV